METLEQLYWKYKKGDWPDKNSVHSYIPIYEDILKDYRHAAKYILEIGLMSGESLRMWNNYFDGTVYGMDCEIKPIGGKADLTAVIKEGYNIVIGDASKKEDVEKYFSKIKFDVIIEDANHEIDQQVSIYQNLKPHLNEGGMYIIEDVQDIDSTRTMFKIMGGSVIDLRYKKDRYDDVLVIFRG